MSILKYYLFKSVQIALFAASFYGFARIESVAGQSLTNTPTSSLIEWTVSLVAFIFAWNISGLNKTFARIVVGVLAYKSLIVLIQHMQSDLYSQVPRQLTAVAPHVIKASLTPPIIMAQLMLLAFTVVLATNASLAEMIWLGKTIIFDWFIFVLVLLGTSLYDLWYKTTYFVLVLAYFVGANILGFAVMRAVELIWSIQSNHLNPAAQVVFDTDDTLSPTLQSSTSTSTSADDSNLVDKTDYSKLSNDELNQILSEPSPSHREMPFDASKVYINNLSSSTFVRRHLRATELVLSTLFGLLSTSSAERSKRWSWVFVWLLPLYITVDLHGFISYNDK
eukprot:gene15418-18285_t